MIFFIRNLCCKLIRLNDLGDIVQKSTVSQILYLSSLKIRLYD